MSTATLCAPRKRKSSASPATIHRKRLVQALERAKLLVMTRTSKPILACVRLEITGGVLTIQATDLETGMVLQVPVEGALAPTVVNCSDLIARLKAGREEACSLSLSADKLIINGGRVEHALRTQDPADFPVVDSHLQGETLDVNAAELSRMLAVTAIGAAWETTRYAINGMLLDVTGDHSRLVATDGRRLVMADLQATGQYTGQVMLHSRYCKLIEKLTAKGESFVTLAVQRRQNDQGGSLSARLYAAGPDWLLATTEVEGNFPRYTDVVPASASRFQVDRNALLETLNQVAVATDLEHRAVRTVLTPRKIALSAGGTGAAEATGSVRAKFLGGGDSEIHTAFNPAYLRDAIKSLDADTIIIDVAQNGCGTDGKVFGKPALIYPASNPTVRWLIMPVHAGLEPSPKSLGSNYTPQVSAGED